MNKQEKETFSYQWFSKEEFTKDPMFFDPITANGKEITDNEYKHLINYACRYISGLTGYQLGYDLVKSITKPYKIQNIVKTEEEIIAEVKMATGLLMSSWANNNLLLFTRGSFSSTEPNKTTTRQYPSDPKYIPDNVTYILQGVGLYIFQKLETVGGDIINITKNSGLTPEEVERMILEGIASAGHITQSLKGMNMQGYEWLKQFVHANASGAGGNFTTTINDINGTIFNKDDNPTLNALLLKVLNVFILENSFDKNFMIDTKKIKTVPIAGDLYSKTQSELNKKMIGLILEIKTKLYNDLWAADIGIGPHTGNLKDATNMKEANDIFDKFKGGGQKGDKGDKGDKGNPGKDGTGTMKTMVNTSIFGPNDYKTLEEMFNMISYPTVITTPGPTDPILPYWQARYTIFDNKQGEAKGFWFWNKDKVFPEDYRITLAECLYGLSKNIKIVLGGIDYDTEKPYYLEYQKKWTKLPKVGDIPQVLTWIDKNIGKGSKGDTGPTGPKGPPGKPGKDGKSCDLPLNITNLKPIDADTGPLPPCNYLKLGSVHEITNFQGNMSVLNWNLYRIFGDDNPINMINFLTRLSNFGGAGLRVVLEKINDYFPLDPVNMQNLVKKPSEPWGEEVFGWYNGSNKMPIPTNFKDNAVRLCVGLSLIHGFNNPYSFVEFLKELPKIGGRNWTEVLTKTDNLLSSMPLENIKNYLTQTKLTWFGDNTEDLTLGDGIAANNTGLEKMTGSADPDSFRKYTLGLNKIGGKNLQEVLTKVDDKIGGGSGGSGEIILYDGPLGRPTDFLQFPEHDYPILKARIDLSQGQIAKYDIKVQIDYQTVNVAGFGAGDETVIWHLDGEELVKTPLGGDNYFTTRTLNDKWEDLNIPAKKISSYESGFDWGIKFSSQGTAHTLIQISPYFDINGEINTNPVDSLAWKGYVNYQLWDNPSSYEPKPKEWHLWFTGKITGWEIPYMKQDLYGAGTRKQWFNTRPLRLKVTATLKGKSVGVTLKLSVWKRIAKWIKSK